MASIRNGLKALSAFPRLNISHEISWSFNNVRHSSKGAYEGDGKTHAVLLNDEGMGLMINGYSQVGFTLNNGSSVIGPIALFPNSILSWNVGTVMDINEKSLSLFLNLYPKLGIPATNKLLHKERVNAIFRMITKRKIQCEILPPETACPTFNFLMAEQRFVGAGLIPPLEIIGEGDGDLGLTSSSIGYPTERN